MKMKSGHSRIIKKKKREREREENLALANVKGNCLQINASRRKPGPSRMKEDQRDGNYLSKVNRLLFS